jgi:hypothetical protein
MRFDTYRTHLLAHRNQKSALLLIRAAPGKAHRSQEARQPLWHHPCRSSYGVDAALMS